MRFTKAQIETIRKVICQNALIWLLGSRVDDSTRGGDIDLYIETTHRNTLIVTLYCKIALEECLDLSVDFLIKESGQDKPIYKLAKSQGIQL